MSPERPSAEAPRTASETAAAPATAPAYALVAADGSVVAASEVFNRLIGVERIAEPALASAVGAITVGNRELIGAELPPRRGDGPVDPVRVEAVLSATDQRLALIEVTLERPLGGAESLTGWFPRFADGSAAIVWLKDLDGRYLWVNRQYSTELGVDSEWVVGHLDSELGQLESIDGPRNRAGSRPGSAHDAPNPRDEPLSLEYTIPGFDRRPAYAALRFPVRDPAGEPLAVCGVASPVDHGELAQRECAHLLEAAAWFGGDAASLRHETMERWGIRAVRPQGSLEPGGAMAVAALPAEGLTTSGTASGAAAPTVAAGRQSDDTSLRDLESRVQRLEAELAGERERTRDLEAALVDARGRADALAASLEVANRRAGYIDTLLDRTRELETMVAAASQAGVAAAQSATRVIALQDQLQELNARLEQEHRLRLAAEAGQSGDNGGLEAERARHQAELAALSDQTQALRYELESARGQLEDAEAAHAEELASHVRHESELSDVQDRVRTELNAANQRHQVELSRVGTELSTTRDEVEELRATIAASRDQIARLERAAVAAAAAAAGPPPAPAPGPERLAQSAPPVQLGWDPAAQQALADGLRGCLNFRSILSETVRLIGTGGGWDAVVAWVPDDREDKFGCAATWVRSPVDMARLETSMWQDRQSATASAVGAAARSGDIGWITTPGADGDRHLASMRAEGMNTIVLLPVRHQGRTSAVLELCTTSSVPQSDQADAALRAIEVEIAAAQARVTDAASAGQWGRRRR